MPDINTLIARRANVWESYQEVLGRAGDDGFSAEDRQTLDRMEADLRGLGEDIERIHRAEALEVIDRRQAPEPAPSPRGGSTPPPATSDEDAYRSAFERYLRAGMSGLVSEDQATLQRGFVDGEELRAQGVATGAAGGFLVPQGFRNVLIETQLFFGAVRAVAGRITTDSGAPLPWPTNDDTANEGAYLAENTAVPEQDVTLGQQQLGAHMITSRMVRVSFQLLQDSAFDLDAWLPRKLGERIARRENRAFTVGTGAGEPQGVVTGALVGRTTAAGQLTSVTYDDLVFLEHSVDVAYRNERSAYMFHDLTLGALRRLKDADGRPLWQPSLTAGAPDTFNGRRYEVNNHMPQMGASARSVLFGDFTAGYIIRDVRDIGVMRLVERYAEFLQVGFLAFARHDGRVDDPGAIRALAHPAA
jgi:HK97 family phage major capsid protein